LLFGQEVEMTLGALEKTLSGDAARTKSNLRLCYMISRIGRIGFWVEETSEYASFDSHKEASIIIGLAANAPPPMRANFHHWTPAAKMMVLPHRIKIIAVPRSG